MKARVWFVLAAVALMSSATAQAIDRDAKLVDFARFNWFDLGDADGWYVDVGGETLLAEVNNEWAVTLGGLYGTISPDAMGDVDMWGVNVGLKFYHTKLTTFTLSAEFIDFMDENGDTRSGTLGMKHRLVSANYDVSPYVLLEGSIRSVDEPWPMYSGQTFTEGLWRIGVGGDLMMDDDLCLNVEMAYHDTESITDSELDLETPDGWVVRVGIKGYWDSYN